MGYIALGVVGFIVAGFFDLAALRGWGHLKQAIGLGALSLWGYAFWGLMCPLDSGCQLRSSGWAGRFVYIPLKEDNSDR